MKKINKSNSIIASTACATARFVRGVVGVATLGLSELAIKAGEGLVGLFKRDSDVDDEDFDDFDDFEVDDDTNDDTFIPCQPMTAGATPAYDCTASDLAEAARVAEEDDEIDAIVDKAIQSQNENQ